MKIPIENHNLNSYIKIFIEYSILILIYYSEEEKILIDLDLIKIIKLNIEYSEKNKEKKLSLIDNLKL